MLKNYPIVLFHNYIFRRQLTPCPRHNACTGLRLHCGQNTAVKVMQSIKVLQSKCCSQSTAVKVLQSKCCSQSAAVKVLRSKCCACKCGEKSRSNNTPHHLYKSCLHILTQVTLIQITWVQPTSRGGLGNPDCNPDWRVYTNLD